MFTARIGTVFEDSRLELRHWCYAFWRASTSKEGVAARDVVRQCRVSYKSALFLMHRVRQAMAPADTRDGNEPAVAIEGGETGCGERPRPGMAPHDRDRRATHGPRGSPEFGVPETGGGIGGRHVVTDMGGEALTLKPGPAPETLKLGGVWQANIAKALQKKPPPGGCPGSRGPVATRRAGVLPEVARGRGRTNSLDRAAPRG